MAAEVTCWHPGCEAAGTSWPTLLIPRVDQDPDPGPFRLEIPRAVCDPHQGEFRSGQFLTEAGMDYMRFLASGWRVPAPDFDRVTVEWLPVDHPTFQSFSGRAARFCAPEIRRAT